MFSKVMAKQFVGTRMIVPYEMYLSAKRKSHEEVALFKKAHESEEEFYLKSLLALVADSGTVEVYLIEKTHMSFLPEQTLVSRSPMRLCFRKRCTR